MQDETNTRQAPIEIGALQRVARIALVAGLGLRPSLWVPVAGVWNPAEHVPFTLGYEVE